MVANERLKALLRAFYFLQILRHRDIKKLRLFPSKSSQDNYIQRMVKNELIKSFSLPLSYQVGRPEVVYCLTQKGVELANEICQTAIKSRISLPKAGNIKHHLLIVEHILDIKERFPEATCAADFNYITTTNKKGKIIRVPILEMSWTSSTGRNLALLPDIEVTIRTTRLYIEVDRATESLDYIRGKLSKYEQIRLIDEYFFDYLIFSVPSIERQERIQSLKPPAWVDVCLSDNILNSALLFS